MSRYDHAALLVLLHAYREEFLDSLTSDGMSDGDARQTLADFEHDAINYEGQEVDAA